MSADTIYLNADVVTVSAEQPSAEAVAVKEGRIVAVGSADAMRAHQGPQTRIVDLQGHTLVPGFIDPHSHFMNALQIVNWANVSAPPVGPVKSIADIVEVLDQYIQRVRPAPGEWIIGYGYDANMLSDGRELTRDDLDPISADNPVLIIHVSLHGGVFNSKALDHFGINAETPTPPGGIIMRRPGTLEPAGLIQEVAFLPIFARMPKPSPDELVARMAAAQTLYAAAGITTATEGATGVADLAVLERAAAEGRFFLDVVSLIIITELEEVLKNHPPSTFGTYRKRLKLHGTKTFADGVPMTRTAFFNEPYLKPGPNGESPWRGEPEFPVETFHTMMKTAYGLKLPLFVHANGDAALDMLLEAHEQTAGDSRTEPRGTTVIHSQFVRRDQLEKYVKYHINASFYTEHTFFFSDAHLSNLGPARTHFCSPMKTAIELGVHATNHTDFSVLPIDQMLAMWTAVNRVSRSGEVIGPDQRVTPLQALRAITIEAAHQYGELADKGSIEAGKLADLTILDKNPLKVDPMAIKDIKVVGTIKQDRPIYVADGAPWLEPAAT